MGIRRRSGADRLQGRWTWQSMCKKLTSAGVAARAALFVVLSIVALSLSVPQPAHALLDSCDWVDQSTNQKADFPGASAENIFPMVKQWDSKGGQVAGATRLQGDASGYTMYELDAMRGLNWASTQVSKEQAKPEDQESAEDDDCSIQNDMYNGIAQMIFDLSKIVSRAAISVKELSSNPSPLAPLYEQTTEGKDSVVDRLNDRVFKFAVPTMIMLTGLWVFGKYRKGDMREVWSGVGWAVFVVVAVSAFLVNGNYRAVIEKADSGIAQGNAVLTEAVLGSATGLIDPPCDLGKGAYNRGMRVSSCAMYDTLAFRPWAIGQFGDPGKNPIPYKGDTKCDFGAPKRCKDMRVKQVVVQSVTNKDYYGDRDDISKKKENQYGELRNYIANNNGGMYDQWSGRKPATRITIGIYALVASFIVGVMVIVLSILTLLWHAVTLILVILLPLIASISIHPSQQKLLRGWWETFVHSFVLRAGFGVILTILLLFYQLILPLNVSLGMQLLLLLLVTVAVVMMLKNLLSGKFSPQVAGAQDPTGIKEVATGGSNTVMAKGEAFTRATPGGVGRVAAKPARKLGLKMGDKIGSVIPITPKQNAKFEERVAAREKAAAQQRAAQAAAQEEQQEKAREEMWRHEVLNRISASQAPQGDPQNPPAPARPRVSRGEQRQQQSSPQPQPQPQGQQTPQRPQQIQQPQQRQPQQGQQSPPPSLPLRPNDGRTR